jgi:hypothetical protein
MHLLPIDLSSGETKNIYLAESQRSRTMAPFKFGQGRGLARVWQFVFERRGVIGTFRARVDATNGELLEFRDISEYG